MQVLDYIEKYFPDASSEVLFKGASSAFVINVIGAGLAFVLQLLLARLMGLSSYGIYVYIVSWLSILVLLATFGFDFALLRFVALYNSEKDWPRLLGILKSSFLYTLVISSVLCLAIIIAVVFFFEFENQELYYTLIGGCVLVPIWSLCNLRQATLRALKKIVYARLPDVIVRPLLMGALVALLWWLRDAEVSAPFTMLIHIIAALLAFILGTYFLKKVLSAELKEAIPSYQKMLWTKTAASLMFVSSMHVILNEVDKIMLGLMVDYDAVGVYSVAARISILGLFALQSINTIAAPMISEYHAAKSKEEFQAFVSKVTKWIIFASLPILVCIVVFGKFVLSLFGDAFLVAYIPLLILTLGQIVNMSVGPVGFLLTMTGKQNTHLVILVISLVVNIVLNVPAIYFFGIYGAAIATAFSIALRNILAWKKTKDLLGVDSSILFAFKRGEAT